MENRHNCKSRRGNKARRSPAGPEGWPVERSVILGLRFGLDLYINLRPIKLYAETLCPIKGKGPDDIDFTVVRENTEGEYTQIGGILKKGTPDEVATVTSIYTRVGVERAIRYGFELARARAAERNRPGHLTLVDKANAIRPQEIWTRTFAEVGREYPDIKQDHAYVDAFTMLMIQQPEHYDMVVTTNLYGDIITDLGSMLQGGIGVAASANLHPGRASMFEPIHVRLRIFQAPECPDSELLTMAIIGECQGWDLETECSLSGMTTGT